MRALVRFVALVLVLLPALAVAQATDVTGTWRLSVTTGQGSGNPTITFKQSGESLTGHYSGTLGEADFTGTLKGSAIRFTFNVNAQGTDVDVVYEGTVKGEAMEGSVAIAGGQLSGSFTGKKQP